MSIASYVEAEEGRLLTKNVKGRTREQVLVCVFYNSAGRLFELKTNDPNEVGLYYRTLEENAYYKVYLNPQKRQSCDPNYSRAEFELFRVWLLRPGPAFELAEQLECETDIINYHLYGQKPANILGGFSKLEHGASRDDGKYFWLTLVAQNGLLYKVSIWMRTSVGNEVEPPSLNDGDMVLILWAREEKPEYRRPGFYSLTSGYPPLVNPDSIVDGAISELRANSGVIREPYDPTD